MKKYLSVFMLMVRMSIWKVLLVFCAMLISQVGLYFALGAGEEAYLLGALERIPFGVVTGIALWLLTAGLCLPMSDRGGRMNNLILRLGMSENRVFWIQVLFNAMIYCLYIMVQAMILLLLSRIYDWFTPGEMDPMTVFAVSYMHPLFHRFFPMHDAVGWICNILMVVGLSVCAAAHPMRQRHGKNSFSSLFMLAYAATYFGGMNTGDAMQWSQLVLPCMYLVVVLPVCLGGVLTLEVDDYGKT